MRADLPLDDGASPDGPPRSASTVGPAGVVFAGAFMPQERSLLARQFSRCRFELLARSSLDDRMALVRWRPLTGGNGAGPRPLFAPPTQATYVLDLSGGPDTPLAGPPGPPAGPPPGLTRVDDTTALQKSFPGHFPGVEVKTPGWLRLRRTWYRLLPLLVAALAAVWLALVLRQMRGP